MSYSRPLRPGIGLKQLPVTIPGVQEFTLDSDVSTTATLGVVQVGSGLSITPAGILSATNSGNNFVAVKLTDFSYSATNTDLYIGATSNNITVTLPLGITGRVYIIKNQANGNIKVKTSGNQKIDTASDKTLGSEDSLTVVFDGTRWNTIDS
jgi:hypothetical protein